MKTFKSSPSLPPPPESVGVIGWLYKNLFSSPTNIVATILTLALIVWLSIAFITWGVVDATFVGDRSACQTISPQGDSVDAKGACWAFVSANFSRILFGLSYADNPTELWRPTLFFVSFIVIVLLFVLPKQRLLKTNPFKKYILPAKKYALPALIVIVPFVWYALLDGSWFGLTHFPIESWGGLLLTLVLAVSGIVFAFPIGLLFALGRRSKLPFVRVLSTIYIEFWRGAPLITFLFMSATLLPLFLGGLETPRVVRAIVFITLFQSAYTAEAIRGGLSAIPKGQFEAADSLGLGWWNTNTRIILPQALTISVPAIVGSFIELVKDTTLVAIIGLSDLFGVTRDTSNATDWLGYFLEGFIVVALGFFVLNFSLSRYSKRLERKKDRSKAQI